MNDGRNNFTHLPLPLLYQGKPKLRGFSNKSEKTSANIAHHVSHGQYIKRRSLELSRFWTERRNERLENHLPEIESGIPILLEIDPSSDIDFLRGLGFEIVCEIDEGFIIVATDDVDLSVLNEKLDIFIEHIKSRCNSPAKVYALCEDSDRLKRILSSDLYAKWSTVSMNEVYIVDIGVSCCGNITLPNRPERKDNETDENYSKREQRWKEKFIAAYDAWDEIKIKRETTIENFVYDYQGEILDFSDDSLNLTTLPDSFSARLKITGKCLLDLIMNFAYIFEVKESEMISIGGATNNAANVHETVNIEPPDSSDPIICVIDSGIQEEHKYISSAVNKTESESLIPNDDSVSDQVDMNGHGTRVAGAILYPASIPIEGTYKLPCWIRNIRVLNKDNYIPLELYPPKIISAVVQKNNVNKTKPSKIFNHSIGSNNSCEIKHMSSWAAEIDNQSYNYDVLFIQAAGNIRSDVISSYLMSGYDYPTYLNRELCRISDPAQSLQALTIGSVSLSEIETEDLISLGKKYEVSAFSRSGPGIWDVLKPEVVECGGTYVLNKGSNPPILTTPPEVCPELIRRSPEGPAFSRDEVGTSFSTPKVSYVASQIEKIMPNAPALLYRALIAQSARWAKFSSEFTPEECITMLRHMGYGIPDVDRATHNNDYRITLITPEILELGDGEAHVFKVPIPEELSEVGDDFDILIEITLSYASSPRRTRRYVKNYLSTWLDWCCSRIGERAETFSQRIFETGSVIDDDGDFKWVLGDATNHGMASGYSRKNGTLQKDWCIIKSNQLSDAFCVAVRGHKGWGSLFKAKYALAVSFEAINHDVAIYEPIRSMIEVETHINNNEIEVEMVHNRN